MDTTEPTNDFQSVFEYAIEKLVSGEIPSATFMFSTGKIVLNENGTWMRVPATPFSVALTPPTIQS